MFLAIQEPLGRAVAVKLLSSQLRDESFRQRFFREASVSARLSSPHIVTIHDYGETDDGELYIVMEHIEGVPLGVVLKREGPMSTKRVCRLGRQVCRGLEVAHDAGMVHRDLKPSNVMLVKDLHGEEFVKILDFGLVKAFGETAAEDGELTGADAILGSPNYMAPEQIRRGIVDPRTDVYATGVLLYRLLTGKLPFESSTSAETMAKHLNDAPPSIDVHLSEVDFTMRQIEGVILRCLEKKPDNRYSSMDEVAEGLEAVERLMTPGPLAPARRSSSIDLTPIAAPFSSATPVSLSGVTGPSLADSPSRTASPTGGVKAATAAGSRLLPTLAAVAVTVTVAGGALWFRGGEARPKPIPVAAIPTTPVQPKPAPATEPTTPVPEPAEPTAQEAVVVLKSEPSGARVRLGKRALGITPTEVKLPIQMETGTFVFEMSGFRSVRKQVQIEPPRVEVAVQMRKKRRRVRRPAVKPPEVKAAEPSGSDLRANPYD